MSYRALHSVTLLIMPYPEMLIKAMREDLTRFGVEETRTPEELDKVIRETKGTVMVVVNSVCGCAAGLARPAIGMALKHPNRPDKVVTVFAGADIAATERARSYFKGYFPSSPSEDAAPMLTVTLTRFLAWSRGTSLFLFALLRRSRLSTPRTLKGVASIFLRKVSRLV